MKAAPDWKNHVNPLKPEPAQCASCAYRLDPPQTCSSEEGELWWWEWAEWWICGDDLDKLCPIYKERR